MIRKSLFVLPFLLVACGTEVAVVEPTYTSISQQVFVPTCATSGCHSGANPEGGLDLTKEKGFDQLFKPVESDLWLGTQWEGFARVEPGEVAASALMPALEHAQGLPVDLQMPSGSRLPDQWVEAIRTWIANGAGNN